jgi:hypothetical protein
MSSDNTTIKIISKLNRQTKEDLISWKPIPYMPESVAGSEAIIGNAYMAPVLDKTFRIFKIKQRFYTDEDTFHWVDAYRLELIDSRGNPTYTFPSYSSVEDLYESVRYKTSGIEGFANMFLSDDEEEGDKDEPLPFNI